MLIFILFNYYLFFNIIAMYKEYLKDMNNILFLIIII